MSFRFKPEDFRHLECCDSFFPGEVATTANQLLDAHIATLPEVKNQCGIWYSNVDPVGTTHRARLWGVEEIKQKKCEHRPSYTGISTFISEGTKGPSVEGDCARCGKRLVAKWEEA